MGSRDIGCLLHRLTADVAGDVLTAVDPLSRKSLFATSKDVTGCVLLSCDGSAFRD
jgi:hypothetical protein